MLPKALLALGDDAFNLCAIETIYYNTAIPALTVSGSFSSDSYVNAILYVPFASLDKFESTYPWNMFLKIQGHNFSTVVVDIVEDSDIEYFNLNGLPVTTPQRGQVLIKKQGHKTQKIIF